jgi:CDP-diacylglycerol---glycerol-3-phosphate 3-phosphatidyltransferase
MSASHSSIIKPAVRARVRAGVEPIARLFGKVGLTPNALTLIGFGIAVVAAGFAANKAWLVAGLLVGFGAIFDLFDGALARATGQVSRLGAFMDSTFDRAGEAVVYIGIAIGLVAPPTADGFERVLYIGPQTDAGAILAVAAMAASFMVSYTRAKSESLGFSSGRGMANIGFAPREVRLVILTLALIMAGLGDALTGWWVLVGALALITFLATITTIQRILFVYRQSKSQEVQN